MKDRNDSIIEIPQQIPLNSNTNQQDFSPDALEDIRKNINALTNPEPKPKSFITLLSFFWKQFHWLTKGVILFSIITPVIILMVYTQAILLLAIACTISLGYIGFSLLLDNHYNTEGEYENSVEKRVGALADFFGIILNKLWGVGRGLQQEVDDFSTQNQILTIEVESFTSENAKFKIQVELLTKEAERFAECRIEFERIINELEQKAYEQELLLKQERDLHLRTQKEHEKTNAQLEAQSTILSINVQALQLKLNHIEHVEKLLRQAVHNLTSSNVKNTQNQQEFTDNLNAILEKAEKQLVDFELEMRTISEKFNVTLARLTEGSEKQEILLQREAKNIEILETFVNSEKKKRSSLIQKSIFKEEGVSVFNKLENTSDIVISVY